MLLLVIKLIAKSNVVFKLKSIEVGTLSWVADGFRLYPFYDIGSGDDEDIINVGVLYHFK